MKLDRTSWTRVKLGDLATKQEENDKANAKNRFSRFLKVEHLDPESLHIKRWGLQSDEELPPTFYKIFRKGQVLFPTRNPHLRRAAFANFDGICGEKTLTLDPNLEIILPNFFPFLFHCDSFYAHTTSAIIGSTNPHVRWRDVAKYEFLLPPINVQVELAKLLWAIDEVIEKNIELLNNYKRFYVAYMNDLIDKECALEKHINISFGELGTVYGGLTGKSKEDFGEGSPFVTYMNVFKNTKVSLEMLDYVRIKQNEKQNQIRYGDIIFTGSSETPDEVGMTAVVLNEVEGIYLNSFCFGFRLNNFDLLIPEYARYVFQTRKIRDFIIKHAQGSTRFNLSKSVINEKLNILLPSIKIQKIIEADLSGKEDFIKSLEKKIEISKMLKKKLINSIF